MVCENCDAGNPSFSGMEVSFDAKLLKPGDSITYEISVENIGNIDAVLNGITTNVSDMENGLKITVSHPTETLEAGSSTIVFITIYYDENVEDIPKNIDNFICNINYIQKT